MILFDINVLVYAHREDQEHHAYFRSRLETIVGGDNPFGLTPLTAGGFIRIVTQPAFPNGPTPLPQALSVIDSLLSHPRGHMIQPGRRHWEIFSQLCRQTQASGKSVADAQHAAVAIEHAATWITRDKDFARFTEHGLKWQHWSPT
ncbi:MAG: type II toxin-antitoxin system VapC family toxin [Puniceicoccaceae bacterium]